MDGEGGSTAPTRYRLFSESRFWLLVVHAVLSQMATLLLRVNTSYRAIEIALDPAWLAIFSVAFSLFPLVFGITAGRATDRYGEQPTLIVGATADMAVMQEEIFGPVLPMLGTRSPADAIAFVNARDRPLALYWFGKDRIARDEVLARTISGGVTVNDCLFHFAQANQPMGGVGASGTGAYHGEWGFRTFSKQKPVFYRSALNRMADLYPPYGAKIARLEKLLRFMS